LSKSAGPIGRFWDPEVELRTGLVVIAILALALASCATIPTPQNASDAVLMLREYDAWAWAVGIALIWADLVLPVPQTVVIAALGIVYGTVVLRNNPVRLEAWALERPSALLSPRPSRYSDSHYELARACATEYS
jgi:hypothetical protein